MKDSGKFIKIKVIQLKSHKFDSTSLLFGQMGYRRGINILEIIQIPKNIVTREFRERPRVIDKLITPGQKNYIFHHLLPLANEIEQLSYEIVISNHKINIRLYITHNGYLSEEKLKFLLKEKSYMVEFAYKSIFKNIEFKNLVGVELEEAWGDVIGYGNYPYKIINNEIIEIDRRSSKLYISVLYLDSSSQIRADQTLTQIDLLINNILSHEIDAHYISVIQPSSNYYFSKNHKENQFIQSENPPKEGVEEDRLEPKINDKMLDVRHSELVQIWDCSTYIVLKSLFSEILEHNVQKVKNIFRNVFSNSNSTGVIKILRKKELRNALSRIIMRDRVNTIKMSTEQLISSFHLPERTFQYFSAGEKIPFFEIPGELEKFGKDKFVIGTSMYGDQLVNNVYLDAEELLYNLAVLGQTKTGKTEFVKNILSSLFEANPSINWIILDWRGEYNDLKDRINSHIEIIKIGSNKKPLKINIFDPIKANPENHAKKVLLLIKNYLERKDKRHLGQLVFKLDSKVEEYILNTLIECTRNKEKRNIQAFFHELQNYKKENVILSHKINYIKEHLEKFFKGFLGEILNTDKSNSIFRDILEGKKVVDISDIFRNHGTTYDLKFLMNLLLKYIFDQVLKNEEVNSLKNLIIIEESQHIFPEIFQEAETSIMGEFPYLLKKVGVGLVNIAISPQTPLDILSFSSIKVIFRVENSNDAIKISRHLNLNSSQEDYIGLMNKREAIVLTPSFSYPFRIKTITSNIK